MLPPGSFDQAIHQYKRRARVAVSSRRDLVGCWSDRDLYQGSMEACDLALCADGAGWYEWSNFGGSFEVLRLRWRRLPPGQLKVRILRYLRGTWALQGSVADIRAGRAQPVVHHNVEEERLRTETLVTSYAIYPDTDALGRPVTVLELEHKVGQANRFALLRHDVAAAEDPTT